MYDDGEGVREDDAQAVAWYYAAAGQGHVDAQFALGNMFAGGRGVAQDDVEAAVWYRKAAEQGHPEADNSLGVLYRRNLRQPGLFIR